MHLNPKLFDTYCHKNMLQIGFSLLLGTWCHFQPKRKLLAKSSKIVALWHEELCTHSMMKTKLMVPKFFASLRNNGITFSTALQIHHISKEGKRWLCLSVTCVCSLIAYVYIPLRSACLGLFGRGELHLQGAENRKTYSCSMQFLINSASNKWLKGGTSTFTRISREDAVKADAVDIWI